MVYIDYKKKIWWYSILSKKVKKNYLFFHLSKSKGTAVIFLSIFGLKIYTYLKKNCFLRKLINFFVTNLTRYHTNRENCKNGGGGGYNHGFLLLLSNPEFFLNDSFDNDCFSFCFM